MKGMLIFVGFVYYDVYCPVSRVEENGKKVIFCTVFFVKENKQNFLIS